MERSDIDTPYSESFAYTSDNQLKSWELFQGNTSVEVFEMNYDTHGNVTGKGDLGYEMKYEHDTKPHAITSIEGIPDIINSNKQHITYTNFNKVSTINEGNYFLSIDYGVDFQRRKATYKTDNNITLTRYYFGDYEEDVDGNNDTTKIYYLSGGDGLAAIYQEKSNVGKLNYAFTDYQGSLIALTNDDGSIANFEGNEQRFAYDPWGNRRNPLDWTKRITTAQNYLTDRGYTLHEHLDNFALINMNGRVYDPLIARLLSPDPMLQAPDNALNYNRYTYCMNNPLFYTDPSGMSWFSDTWNWITNNPLINPVAGLDWLNENIAPSIDEFLTKNNISVNAGGGYNTANGYFTYGGNQQFYHGQGSGDYSAIVNNALNVALSDGSMPYSGDLFDYEYAGLRLSGNVQYTNPTFLQTMEAQGIIASMPQALSWEDQMWAITGMVNDAIDGHPWPLIKSFVIGSINAGPGAICFVPEVSGVEMIAAAKSATGEFYSVAYEMELSAKSYPGVSRYMHFKEANISLDAAMRTNPALSELGISVPRSPAGGIIGKSPSGWVWHHNIETGVMQLVPKIQHPSIPGGIFWETMHPGGVGGYSIWGQ